MGSPLQLGPLLVSRFALLHVMPTLALLWLTFTAYGWWAARGHLMYMGLILAWSCPICAVQWLYGGTVLWRDAALLLPVVAASSVYLWCTDYVAITDGIWWISEKYTTGHMLPLLTTVPIE